MKKRRKIKEIRNEGPLFFFTNEAVNNTPKIFPIKKQNQEDIKEDETTLELKKNINK